VEADGPALDTTWTLAGGRRRAWGSAGTPPAGFSSAGRGAAGLVEALRAKPERGEWFARPSGIHSILIDRATPLG
jgi:hypothetical protein